MDTPFDDPVKREPPMSAYAAQSEVTYSLDESGVATKQEEFRGFREIQPGDYVTPGYYDRIYQAPGVVYFVCGTSGPFVLTTCPETNGVVRFDTRFTLLYLLDRHYALASLERTACADWIEAEIEEEEEEEKDSEDTPLEREYAATREKDGTKTEKGAGTAW